MEQAKTPARLLEIRDLSVSFYTSRGVVRAVRALDLLVERGETLALVGESGCGKSVTAHSINRLVPCPPGKIESGQVLFEGVDLLALSEKEVQQYRGEKISMIFQEPMTSLNPVFKVGRQIADVFLTHHRITRAEAFRRAVELLEMVRIPAPDRRAHSYPHQLSGGMRQRVMIALALASPSPGLLIADEPTTALDVTIQAQILELLKELQQKISMGILLITHDMGVVAENADRVIVMYAGRKVEEGAVGDVVNHPAHPYTVGLLNSLPSNAKYREARRLETIGGSVPDMITVGEGCPFADRCRWRGEVCDRRFPDALELSEERPGSGQAAVSQRPSHRVWCHWAAAVRRGEPWKS